MASGSETIREDQNATIREGQDSNATVREGQSAVGVAGGMSAGASFRDYQIVRQLPSTSTEADIFIIEKDGTQYILKLYRYGINPKNDILQKIKTLSAAHPQELIQVFEADFDTEHQRWFEIQEYARFGTLQSVIDDRSILTEAQQGTLFNDVAREVGEALGLLHKNDILHLDLKPSNILLRSLNPLKLVLIDFGLATSLASDMSKKFTQTRGTPMYQSPESWSGGVGKPADWWGLGMILLEIAEGAHPFRGMQSNVIERALATRPAPIPDKLDVDRKELLYGLLTRDPDNRWNWGQVSRWLGGERGIPQFFEASVRSELTNATKPFDFMGKQCHTIAELGAAFAANEEAWEKGKTFLLRGNVRMWLEQNGEFEHGDDLERFLSEVSDSDEKMFRFTQRYGSQLPFIFGGKVITLQNLFLFMGKVIKRENPTAMEEKIVTLLPNGTLHDYLDYHIKQGEKSDKEMALQAALKDFIGKSPKDIMSALDFYFHPQNYYCPFLQDISTPESVVKEVSGWGCLPITLAEWDRLVDGVIVPADIMEKTRSMSTYHEAISRLELLKDRGSLVSTSDYSDNEAQAIQILLPCLDMSLWTQDVLDFYLHPKKYYCPFVTEASISDVKNFSKIITELSAVPERIEAWRSLNEKYILPEVLVYQTNSSKTYTHALAEIKDMERKKYLLLHDGRETKKKKALASAPMEKYLNGVFDLQWKYNDAKVKSALEKFQREDTNAMPGSIKKAKLQLWIVYLSLVLEGRFTLIGDDDDILRKISLSFTDAVLLRLTDLGEKEDIFTAKQAVKLYVQEEQKYDEMKKSLPSFVIGTLCAIPLYALLIAAEWFHWGTDSIGLRVFFRLVTTFFYAGILAKISQRIEIKAKENPTFFLSLLYKTSHSLAMIGTTTLFFYFFYLILFFFVGKNIEDIEHYSWIIPTFPIVVPFFASLEEEKERR